MSQKRRQSPSVDTLEGEALEDTSGAARFMGCSYAFIKKLRLEGRGPAFVKIGRAVRYRPRDLIAFVEQRVVQTEDSRD